jgi:hypothetical protein
MRIWDIEPSRLCRKHLLGEHRELHGLWNILTQEKKGYSRHPETLRWKGKTAALRKRHQELLREMIARGYRHCSSLDSRHAKGGTEQSDYVDAPDEQIEILRRKGCGCRV